MTATAATIPAIATIERPDLRQSILLATGLTTIAIRAGAVVDGIGFGDETPIDIHPDDLAPGSDLVIHLDGDRPIVSRLDVGIGGLPLVGGFHFAPGGNATARDGGDDTPAINPFSCWDAGFRPACPDPRGMTLVELTGGGLFWADIYLLGIDHLSDGTSKCGATIADGVDKPEAPEGKGKVAKLDYETAASIYAHHGKQLLGAEEFFAAAYGVRERCSRDEEPKTTGALDDGAARFISRRGLFDVTGTMWQWGTDGDPDEPRASIFGGSWVSGRYAGSRYANLDSWPENSDGSLSARGRSDHLMPDAPAR